ncbi:Uncharacterised protein [Escherichia coli]|nr:Uncharacterised protein [Escherichia coli]
MIFGLMPMLGRISSSPNPISAAIRVMSTLISAERLGFISNGREALTASMTRFPINSAWSRRRSGSVAGRLPGSMDANAPTFCSDSRTRLLQARFSTASSNCASDSNLPPTFSRALMMAWQPFSEHPFTAEKGAYSTWLPSSSVRISIRLDDTLTSGGNTRIP